MCGRGQGSLRRGIVVVRVRGRERKGGRGRARAMRATVKLIFIDLIWMIIGERGW